MPERKYRAVKYHGLHSWLAAGKERSSEEKALEDLEKMKDNNTYQNAKFMVMTSDMPGYNGLPDYED